MMQPSTLDTPSRKSKPSRWWILATVIAGAAGATGAVAAGGHGTYRVPPFTMELRARPAAYGKTILRARTLPLIGQVPVRAEAGTHKAPLELEITITDVSEPTATDLAALRSPRALSSYLADNAKTAGRNFAIRVGLLALAGGTAGGFVVSLGRWRRVLGGALAGLLLFATVGLLIAQTYDSNQFSNTGFVIEQPGQSPPPTPS